MEGMLGGIVGLVGAGLQAQAQAAQVQYEYAALNWQKQRAREQDRFAQAGREDAFGNLTAYDPGRNKWTVTLTPEQKTMQQAGTKEQLLQLTKDAPAARAVREAVQRRAKEAKEPYEKAALGYRYDQPPSEASTRADITQLMAVNEMKKSKADQALLIKQALRMDRGGSVPEIIAATNAQLGANTNNRMLEARKMALGEHAARLQQHEQEWGIPMKVWGDIMGAGGQMPNIGKDTLNQSIDAMINQQSGGMEKAFAQGTAGVGGAMQALAKAVGQSPNMSGIKFGGGGGGKQKAAATDAGITYNPQDDTYEMDPTNYSGSSTYSPASDWNYAGYGGGDSYF